VLDKQATPSRLEPKEPLTFGTDVIVQAVPVRISAKAWDAPVAPK
jgi:hypothetical protein